MEVSGQRHAPAALPPGNNGGTRCVGGWVGPRAGLGGYGEQKVSCPLGWNPGTAQSVTNRHPGVISSL